MEKSVHVKSVWKIIWKNHGKVYGKVYRKVDDVPNWSHQPNAGEESGLVATVATGLTCPLVSMWEKCMEKYMEKCMEKAYGQVYGKSG